MPARLSARAAPSARAPRRAELAAGVSCVLTLVLIAADMLVPGQSDVLYVATLISAIAACALFAFVPARVEPVPVELAELIRDRDAAQSASAAKSRYLANVSHEIRSPLNAIYGYAQLVEQETAVDPRDAARVIRRSAEHLTNLVEGLLDIASVEQGIVRIDNAVVRLGPVVEQVADMFRPQAEAKGLEFRCETPDRLPEFVRMDVRRVRQVLINLVSNAVKFTASGTVVLSLKWAGQTATFEVRDTGPGIASTDAEQAFMPFERMDQTGAGEASGAGLGLAITRAIVNMLGGDISVDSLAGHGTCFTVRLLMPQVSGVVDRAAAALRPTGYTGDRRSLLLVDDDPDNRSLLRSALGELGFELSQASDGHTALALAGQTHFDAVILDVSMPGISGWEAAAHLRAVHGAAMRIIMLSANASERHGASGQEPDHDRFLLKPIDLSLLIDTLGELLGLEWTRPVSADAAKSERRDSVPELTPAALEHAQRLKSLVRIGHVRALEDEIRNLERADPNARVLIATLYDCLDRFDLAGLGRTLEEF
nr:hybrid sensor histidine kinase/response regulator [Novosphingobium hassiacum]